MAIAVLISSIALLLSALASVGTYLTVRKLQSQVSPLVPQVTEFLLNSRAALDEALKQFHETGEKTQAVLDDLRAVRATGLTHLMAVSGVSLRLLDQAACC